MPDAATVPDATLLEEGEADAPAVVGFGLASDDLLTSDDLEMASDEATDGFDPLSAFVFS